MRLSTKEVMEIAKKFLRTEAEHDTVKIESVEADKKAGEWVVYVDVGFLGYEPKKVVIDDSDGNVLSYTDAEDEDEEDEEDKDDDDDEDDT